jgi:hypothetical protein
VRVLLGSRVLVVYLFLEDFFDLLFLVLVLPLLCFLFALVGLQDLLFGIDSLGALFQELVFHSILL